MNIKISVILPVYNGEKYIEQCLNSIIEQTLKEIEIIVINDGSKDNTKNILEKYNLTKNIKIINKENEGASKSRNLGLNISKGKYIYFIDADDYIEKNALERLYIKAEKENLDIVVFDYYNESLSERKYIKNLDIEETENISGKIYVKYLLGSEKKIVPAIWGKLIKKDIYTKNNIRFPEKIFIGEDVVVGIKTAYFAEKVGKINEALYHYILHENQGTKKVKKDKEFLDIWNGIDEIEKFFKEDKNNEYKNEIERRRINFYFELIKNLEKIEKIDKEWVKNIDEIKRYGEYKKLKLYKKVKLYILKKKIRKEVIWEN